MRVLEEDMFEHPVEQLSKRSVIQLSVLIPVYNVQKWLGECLDSLSVQTLENVEYIFVDDGSTDRSGELLDSFAFKDARVKVIHLSDNEGLLKARKHAIDAASGKYTLILDSDDFLPSKTTLEELLFLAQTNNVNILQFSIACCGGVQEQVSGNENYLNYPTEYSISGYQSILNNVFSNKKKGTFTLWNKIYRTAILKQAAKHIPDRKIICAEDIFLFFIICLYAKTYKRVLTPPYYVYRLGSGVSTGDVTIEKYHQYAAEPLIIKDLQSVIKTTNYDEDPVITEALQWLKSNMLDYQLYRLSLLQESQRPEGLGYLLTYNQPQDVIGKFSQTPRFSQEAFVNMALDLKRPSHQPEKTTQVLAIYADECTNEHFFNQHIPILQTLNYQLVLISEKEKILPSILEGVSREALPASYSEHRAQVWSKIAQTHKVDAVLYLNSYHKHCPYDTVLLQQLGVKVIYFQEESACLAVLRGPQSLRNFSNQTQRLQLADALIVTDALDKVYYDQLGIPTTWIPTLPTEVSIRTKPYEHTHQKVFWIATGCDAQSQKQAISILKRALALKPSIVCEILVDDAFLSDELKQWAIEDERHVKLIKSGENEQLKVFLEATVMLLVGPLTSNSISRFRKAQVLGIPVVTYDLPELSLNDGGLHNHFSGYEGAARSIMRILDNPELAQSLSLKAASVMKHFGSENIKETWLKVLGNDLYLPKVLNEQQKDFRLHQKLMNDFIARWDLEPPKPQVVIQTEKVYVEKPISAEVLCKIQRYDQLVGVVKKIAPDGSVRKKMLWKLVRGLKKLIS